MVDLKLRKIGNSYGVVLPKEVLGRLRLAEGDRLFLTETPDGGYRITRTTRVRAPDRAGRRGDGSLPQHVTRAGGDAAPRHEAGWVARELVTCCTSAAGEHGGAPGLRDEGLDSALADPPGPRIR